MVDLWGETGESLFMRRKRKSGCAKTDYRLEPNEPTDKLVARY